MNINVQDPEKLRKFQEDWSNSVKNANKTVFSVYNDEEERLHERLKEIQELKGVETALRETIAHLTQKEKEQLLKILQEDLHGED